MNNFFLILQSAIFILLSTVQMFAQTSAPTTNQIKTDEKNADVSITANVTARELKFEIVPNPTVDFPGKPERQNVWEADRENLPRPVEPGVTYRNIGVKLRIASRFADIERIVAGALGETPKTEETPETTQPISLQNENKSDANEVKPISQTINSRKRANNQRK